MQIQIDQGSNRPVYQQVVDRVKRDVALSRLRPGEKLPTVRSLASQLVINPNTIAKAYRTLEQQGVIVTRPGSGAFVAAPTSGLNMSVKKEIITAQMERLIVDSVHMAIDAKRLRQWFDEQLARFDLPNDD